MYITNIHLKLLNYIQLKNNINIDDISQAFLYTPQVLRKYLLDIFEHTNLDKKNLTIPFIIQSIKNDKSLKSILKKHQTLSKDEKMYYIFFSLLIHKNINLTEISKILGITKRNLNYLLDDLKKFKELKYLKIKSTSQGVTLIGVDRIKINFKFHLTLKFLIDRQNYHPIIRNLFFSQLKNINLKEINFLLKELHDTFKHNHSHNALFILIAFHTFIKNEQNIKIKDISPSDIFKYRDKDLDYFTFYKIFNLIQYTSLKEIDSSYFCIIVSYIKRFFYIHNTYEQKVIQEAIKIKNIVNKYLDFKLIDNKEFYNVVSRMVAYCNFRKNYFIDDIFLLTSNLSVDKNSNILKMTKDIQIILPKFTLCEGATLYYKLTDSSNKKHFNYIFVYQNIENLVVNSIKNKIENIHNIKIKDSVLYKHLENYIKLNPTEKIITIENLNLDKFNIKYSIYNIH